MSDKPFKIVNGEAVELTEAEIAELASLQSEWEAGATDRQWAVVRTERNARLAASDWTQLADNPLSGEDRALWADYRQALRDITTQADPFNISWPVEP
jgi:hypothetical protein